MSLLGLIFPPSVRHLGRVDDSVFLLAALEAGDVKTVQEYEEAGVILVRETTGLDRMAA
jgi:hypothetical protein